MRNKKSQRESLHNRSSIFSGVNGPRLLPFSLSEDPYSEIPRATEQSNGIFQFIEPVEEKRVKKSRAINSASSQQEYDSVYLPSIKMKDGDPAEKDSKDMYRMFFDKQNHESSESQLDTEAQLGMYHSSQHNLPDRDLSSDELFPRYTQVHQENPLGGNRTQFPIPSQKTLEKVIKKQFSIVQNAETPTKKILQLQRQVLKYNYSPTNSNRSVLQTVSIFPKTRNKSPNIGFRGKNRIQDVTRKKEILVYSELKDCIEQNQERTSKFSPRKTKMSPLRFWMGERLVYRESGNHGLWLSLEVEDD